MKDEDNMKHGSDWTYSVPLWLWMLSRAIFVSLYCFARHPLNKQAREKELNKRFRIKPYRFDSEQYWNC